jgi:hypothetical protein
MQGTGTGTGYRATSRYKMICMYEMNYLPSISP